MKKGKPRISKGSGDQDAGGGFKKIGRIGTTESPAGSSPPDFSKCTKTKGPKYHGA